MYKKKTAAELDHLTSVCVFHLKLFCFVIFILHSIFEPVE